MLELNTNVKKQQINRVVWVSSFLKVCMLLFLQTGEKKKVVRTPHTCAVGSSGSIWWSSPYMHGMVHAGKWRVKSEEWRETTKTKILLFLKGLFYKEKIKMA